MTTNNHPAHGPVSLDRLHQISEILSKASAQSDGGNLGYAMADAVKVIDAAIAALGVDNKTTHNSVIAEQLAHIISVMEVKDHHRAIISCAVDRLNKNADTICQLSKAACSSPDRLDYQGAKELFNYLMTEEETNATVNGWNACRSAMLQAGNSPVTQDTWIPVSERMPPQGVPLLVCSGNGVVQRTVYGFDGENWLDWYEQYDPVKAELDDLWQPLPAAPQQEVNRG
jgi:hypothetical protein